MLLVCFYFLGGTVSYAAPKECDNSGDFTFITETGLISLAIVSGAYWLSPLGGWRAEINTLTDDEMFVRRQLLLTTDRQVKEYGVSVLAKIRSQKQTKHKKIARFNRWFYPAVVTSGTIAIMIVRHFRLRDR